MRKIFVYGTLKQGLRWHHIIAACKSLGDTTISGFKLINYARGNYPIMIQSGNPDDFVYGEVYEVASDKVWQQLMWLEEGYSMIEVQPGITAFYAPQGTDLYEIAMRNQEVPKVAGIYDYAA